MKIELERSPRSRDATDEHCCWYLRCNGYVLGVWFGGKEKKYLDPEKWAKEQIKKRNPIIDRNIKRLEQELDKLKKEKFAINS